MRDGIFLILIAYAALASSTESVLDRIQRESGEQTVEVSSLEPLPISKPIESGDSFLVATREQHLAKFPCQNCHSNLKPNQSDQVQLAHWNIELSHPKFNEECSLCHSSDAKLHLLSGESLSFDDSYKLCGQCHGLEQQDWQHGAHGKRLTGWGVTRVVQNCTGRHNPHDPKFPTRKPTTHANLPLRGESL